MPFRLFRTLGFLVSINLVSTCLIADEADQIETVTVSATPVSIEEAGSSVSIITRQEILDRNSPSIIALLREIPGFAVNQQGSNGALAQVRVRGAESNQVLVLINGIEANEAGLGGEFDFSQLSTADIERIEIVRGPQSALWGSDAMAGVIHIITIPEAVSSGVQAGIEAGSFGTTRGSISASHAMDRNLVRFSLDYINTDGTNISRTGGEDDGLDNLTLGIAGRYHAADSLQIDYSVRRTDKSSEFDDTDFISTGLPVDADFFTDTTYLYAGLKVRHTLTERLDHALGYAITDTDNETDTGNVIRDKTRGKKNQFRYQLNYANDANRISLIAEHEEEKFRQRGAASPFGDPNQNRNTQATSIAAEYRYDGNRLNLSFSARHDNNSEFDDADPWRVTALYRFDPVTLHAAIGESTRNPTFTDRFGYFTNFIGNPDLKPETSEQWEIGARTSLLDDQIDLGLTWFSADLNNEINGFVFDPVTFGFTAANVDGKSEREGAEFELAYRPAARIDIRLAYTYLNATQEDAAGTDVTEVRRPEHSGTLSMNYRWDQAGVNLAVIYSGDQQDDYFPPYPPFQERVSLDGYTLASLSGYYEMNDQVTVTARLENLTDSDYEQVYGYESPGVGGYLGLRMTW